jgi:hypothetical protein
MQFKIKGKDPVTKVLWPEESVYKATGGFTLDKTNLKDGTDYLEKGALMAADFKTRKAKLVKTAVVHEAAGETATSIKVEKKGKSHHFKKGDNIAKTVGGAAYAISNIDTSNSEYDVIKVGTTLGETLAVGDVLFESSATGVDAATEANVANAILIHDAEIEEQTTVNVGLQIFEIIEANLPYGVTAKNKESLTSRFHFV